jgi:division protein CdvB (Snf7/Vps24/ESCRT-III family)
MEMEKQVLAQVNKAIGGAITQELVGYNKPLNKLVECVIEKHSVELFETVDKAFSNLVTSNEFKQALDSALQKQLARTLISRMGGELEKRVNELKANPQTKAKITLAISSIIDEL